jgi:peptide/nickel transport system ATP-binding protein
MLSQLRCAAQAADRRPSRRYLVPTPGHRVQTAGSTTIEEPDRPSAERQPDAVVLRVEGLRVRFDTSEGVVRAVNGVSFEVGRGETLAVVGESGSGKSVTALSIQRLLPSPPAWIEAGHVWFGGRDLLTLSEAEMRQIRGNAISMIFQEPMTSLDPVMTVGRQIAEAIEIHQDLPRKAALDAAVAALDLVRVPEPARRARQYPFQLSGGLRQRVMIAMAMACNPRLLIADEPTTALDVTIQAQILNLMDELKERVGASIVLITHDMGVVAEMAQRVVVMYAGQVVEGAEVEELFNRPRHPYTFGLLGSVPRLYSSLEPGAEERRLQEIPGTVPSMRETIAGCAFAPRCRLATERCRREAPPLEQKHPGHVAACWESAALAAAHV